MRCFRSPWWLLAVGCACLLAGCGSKASSGVGHGEGSDAGLSARLPAATGPCPELTDGTHTFAPSGLTPRAVRIWSAPASAKPGPLVFYWHGTGSAPSEALVGLGQAIIDAITAQGGIVAAPSADPAAGVFPWFLVSSASRDDDLRVADEVVACAAAQGRLDPRRIHSLGMSAGGLQTAQMSFRRSSYLASVVTYSGGLPPNAPVPASEEPANLFAALVFHGGANDIVFLRFQDAGEAYWRALTGAGHFAAICDHGLGHRIPTDARASVWEFLQAHPYGQRPSPYSGGLPASFPGYCGLSP